MKNDFEKMAESLKSQIKIQLKSTLALVPENEKPELKKRMRAMISEANRAHSNNPEFNKMLNEMLGPIAKGKI